MTPRKARFHLSIDDSSLVTALKVFGSTIAVSTTVVAAVAMVTLLGGCAYNAPKSPWISPASFTGHPPDAVPNPLPKRSLTVYARASQPTNLTRPRPDWLVKALEEACAGEPKEYCRYPMVAHCHGDTPTTIYCHAHPGGEYQHTHKDDKEFQAAHNGNPALVATLTRGEAR